MSSDIERDLDDQLRMTHDRFVTAMNRRLPSMPLEQKERYFAVLSALTAKLEDGKALRDVMQEMMGEFASLLFQEMQTR